MERLSMFLLRDGRVGVAGSLIYLVTGCVEASTEEVHSPASLVGPEVEECDLGCCEEAFGPFPIERPDQAICAAVFHGLPEPIYGDYVASPLFDFWQVDSVLTGPCETPEHYTGVTIWLDAHAAFVSNVALVLTTDSACSDDE